MHAFRFRTSLIPGLFEVTEDRFTKHDLIFRHILGLRTQEILSNNTSTSIDQILYVEQKIHKELNFIFKVANKHPKLLKDPKFIYVRNLFVDSSYAVGAYINMYQKIVKIYNNYVTMSRYSLFGLLLPISIKPEI